MSKKTILEIINLKKYFVNKNNVNKAVDDVSFDLKEGEIVGLIGESGSGKTTIGRSLLRLYNDYNGFVRLDGKIISGKRISKKRKKFMHKNIQMIFQDPMASLNGQNTIFSILKEPLIVNGIIKNKIKNIKKDWKDVTNNFRYTFLEQELLLRLENLKIINKLHIPLIKKWEKLSENIQFDIENNIDDQFNSYFAYLEERTKINSQVINNLYKNNEKLIQLFEQKQSDFRHRKIDLDEIDLEEAKLKYKKVKQLASFSPEYFGLKDLYNDQKAYYKEQKVNFKDTVSISKTSIKNFLAEVKNEYTMHKNDARSTTFLDLYFHEYKLYLINYSLYRQLKQNYRLLKFLSFEDLVELSDEFRAYSQDFYTKLNVDTRFKTSIKELQNIVSKEYNFDLSKFIQRSQHLGSKLRQNYKEAKKTKNKTFFRMFVEFFKDPQDVSDQIKVAKEELKQKQEVFNSELAKYLQEYSNRIYDIRAEIDEALKFQQELRSKDNVIFENFKKNHTNFIKFYKENLIEPLLKEPKVSRNNALIKQRQIDLNIYKTNVSDRLNGIESFKIETKYLNANLSDIRLLMGISSLDMWLQNRWCANFVKLLIAPYRFLRVGNLYVRNIIYKSLEDVGLLKQFAYRYPHEFSGGQRQRIVIARALITEPKVIVADEPIASLDISIQAQVVNLLKDLCKQKNIAMIFIAHDLSMIEYVADRVQIMHLGKIVESGQTEEIYAKPIHPYTLNLFKAIPKISNANEKFQDVKFELSYLDEQQFPNIPTIHTVEKNKHYIYATDEQAKKWKEGKYN
ncbi:ATP-binding cassette domain-containing protein [Mycoplasma sp. 21DD0573]|uniref:ATP-binding cassette domain-containing protein n=1 Tax=unclassified Mycoplasma TaxID=2683645 RepID=UPI002B1E2B4C|nr:ATP-binding cassette domain-containing protein [Mycoplasma sp. 21DD0573]MEA4276423.1 ATP-binding cassette domain-containing protein [Mycoplasma sp. 21DD0573]